MAETAPKSVEDVRKLVDKMGIEFVFAQFVEMVGKPNAGSPIPGSNRRWRNGRRSGPS